MPIFPWPARGDVPPAGDPTYDALLTGSLLPEDAAEGLRPVAEAFAALNAALGKHRRTDAHPMLQAAARRVAQVFDVKYIVMGHSHRMVEEAVGNSTRYFNLGSWTGRSNDGFPHVVVTGGLAELRRWKGPSVVNSTPDPLISPAMVPIPA